MIHEALVAANNDLQPEVVDAIKEAFGPDRSKHLITDWKKRLLEHHPVASVVEQLLIAAMASVDWNRIDLDQRREVLKSLPDIQADSKGRAQMSSCWPFWLASHISSKWNRAYVDMEPDGKNEGSCDVFVRFQDAFEGILLSRSIKRQTPGLAFECKAIDSAGALEKNIQKCSSTLRRYGEGIAAIDVSQPLCEASRRLGGADIDKFHEQCESLLEHFRSRAKNFLISSPKLLTHIRGIIVHASVLSERRYAVNMAGCYVVYQYERYRSTLCAPHGHDVHPNLAALIEHLGQRPSLLWACPPRGLAFATRSGTTLKINTDPLAGDISASVEATADQLGPISPLTTIQFIIDGKPSDQQLVGRTLCIAFQGREQAEPTKVWIEASKTVIPIRHVEHLRQIM